MAGPTAFFFLLCTFLQKFELKAGGIILEQFHLNNTLVRRTYFFRHGKLHKKKVRYVRIQTQPQFLEVFTLR